MKLYGRKKKKQTISVKSLVPTLADWIYPRENDL